MKITTWTIQTPRSSPKIVTQNILRWNETLSKKWGFPENPTALIFCSKFPPSTLILVQHCFFNPTIWKPTATACRNTLTFDQYLFRSRSNMHVNLVYWISLHPKKAILATFSGKTPNFVGENEKIRTNNLHHRKAVFVAVFFSLRLRVNHLQKMVQ